MYIQKDCSFVQYAVKNLKPTMTPDILSKAAILVLGNAFWLKIKRKMQKKRKAS